MRHTNYFGTHRALADETSSFFFKAWRANMLRHLRQATALRAAGHGASIPLRPRFQILALRSLRWRFL